MHPIPTSEDFFFSSDLSVFCCPKPGPLLADTTISDELSSSFAVCAEYPKENQLQPVN